MRQPSLRAIGANHCSRARRNPASAPTRLTSTISPPGFSTRANSSSVASGFGTVVMTYCATTTSNEASGNDRLLGVHHPESLDIGEAELGDPLLRLAQHRLGNIDAADAAGARIVRQRDAGADADLEDAAADALGGGDRGLAPALENRAEHEIVDRRPAGIGLRDRLLVEFGVRQIGHELAPLSCDAVAAKIVRAGVSPVRRPSPSAVLGARWPPAATFWTCPMNWRALFSHERLSANSRQASREILQRLEAGDAQILVQHADRMVADDVLRPGDRKGRDRHAAGQRLELHDAERVGPARKYEDVGRCQMRGQVPFSSSPRNFASGKRALQLRLLRAVADHDLGARQIERQKCFEVLFDRDAADGDEDRSREVELDRAVRPEQIGVDAARPHAEIAEAALAELAHQRWRGHHRDGRGGVEAAQHRVDPAFGNRRRAPRCIRESASCSWW